MIKFDNPYWSNRMKISYLQRRIIVYSLQYYELNKTVVSDSFFDSVCKQLLDLKKADTDAYRASEYYYAFKDFDGNTGFDLCDKLKESDKVYLTKIAVHVLNLYEGDKKKLKAKVKKGGKRKC